MKFLSRSLRGELAALKRQFLREFSWIFYIDEYQTPFTFYSNFDEYPV